MIGARFEVRDFVDADEPALLELHQAGFAGHSPRTVEQWRWKYRRNPLQRVEIVVVTERGAGPAAVYCGVTHRALLDGRECFAGVHTDVTVAPRFTGTPTGARLIAAAGDRFFARWAGGATLLTWGFPEPPLQRIGLRFLRFEVLRDVNFLVREAEAARQPAPADVVVERVERFGALADELWSVCATELRTGVVRDARYLDWRFADQPACEHVLLVARDRASRSARGLAVLRAGGWSEELASLLEWLVPRDDRAAEAALVAAALGETARLRRRWLACWFAGAHLELHRFQRDHGFFVQPTPYQECFRSWTRRAGRRYLAQHWYQTMGDVDFF
jgi:hypothetical protein